MSAYTEAQRRANYNVHVIPHREQRYPTVGDYWWDEAAECWQISISQMPDPRWERLILIHELVELSMCVESGVSESDIDRFDFEFEAEIKAGTRDPLSEPGDDPRAPYYKEHQAATQVERAHAEMLGVNWEEYDGCIRRM